MDFSLNGLNFLKKREGLELQAYNKDGFWTIGYGNTYYEDGSLVKKGDIITIERANSLFNTIAKQFAKRVYALLTVKVSQNQFDALVSIAYNIGIPRFQGSTLLKKVNLNPNDKSIRTEFLKWVNSQGKKLNGLVTRRGLEADLYFSEITFFNISVSKKLLWWIVPVIVLGSILYFTKAHKYIFNWLKSYSNG